MGGDLPAELEQGVGGIGDHHRQRQAFGHVARREIHPGGEGAGGGELQVEERDNIGQLLTLAKIQLQSATTENIQEVSNTITKGLTEVRALSKLINPEAMSTIDLREAVQLEIDRFNRLNFITSTLEVSGNERDIEQKSSIIIFRILQEFFSNTIKHARASELNVTLAYGETDLLITAKDNGIGFSSEVKKEGIGLINIKNRAKLINATAQFTSEKNKGTTLEIHYTL